MNYTEPHVPTPEDIIPRMLSFASVKPDETVFDLGSGDARIVIVAARDFHAKAVGVETRKRLVKASRRKIRELGLSKRAKVTCRNFKRVSERIASDAGVADISGYTDYGRVWSEFLAQVEDDLHPRATVIVLGDARTNGRDPRSDIFAHIAERAGRTFWLNPEPRLYWNYGDSVIAAYEEFCTAFECWTTAQLEDFVRALTRPVIAAAR